MSAGYGRPWGVESRPRDFRDRVVPEGLPQTLTGLQRTGDVRQACPECPIGIPRPLCPVCLGRGSITNERLDRWQLEVELSGLPESYATPNGEAPTP